MTKNVAARALEGLFPRVKNECLFSNYVLSKKDFKITSDIAKNFSVVNLQSVGISGWKGFFSTKQNRLKSCLSCHSSTAIFWAQFLPVYFIKIFPGLLLRFFFFPESVTLRTVLWLPIQVFLFMLFEILFPVKYVRGFFWCNWLVFHKR